MELSRPAFSYQSLLALEKIEFKAPDKPQSDPVANFTIEAGLSGEDETVPLPMALVIGRILQKTDGWPRRVGQSLFVHDESGIHWLESAPAFFGWLAARVGVVEWRKMSGCVTKEEVFHELRRTAQSYGAVESLPHFPPLAGHYYACGEIEAGDGRSLDRLVNFFTPATPQDRMLILAMFVTPFWGGRPGSRPAFLVTSDDGRGVGKSIITDFVAQLAGGSIDLETQEESARMRTRFLSPEGLKRRVARLDNVKTMRFSWAELESIITASYISGHRLHQGEAGRPNIFTWLITLNGASLSTDMAQRVVTVKLGKPPGRIGAWKEDVSSFIENYRSEIIGDIKSFFAMDPEPVTDHNRWAAWEDEVLGRLVNPMEIKDKIKNRSESSDVEAEEIEMIESFFYRRLAKLGYRDQESIHIPSEIVGRWFNECTRDKKTTITACRVITQFCKEDRTKHFRINSSRKFGRGFIFFMSSLAEKSDANYEIEKYIAQYFRNESEF